MKYVLLIIREVRERDCLLSLIDRSNALTLLKRLNSPLTSFRLKQVYLEVTRLGSQNNWRPIRLFALSTQPRYNSSLHCIGAASMYCGVPIGIVSYRYSTIRRLCILSTLMIKECNMLPNSNSSDQETRSKGTIVSKQNSATWKHLTANCHSLFTNNSSYFSPWDGYDLVYSGWRIVFL